MGWYWATWGWAVVLAPAVWLLDVAGMGFWPAAFLTGGLFILYKRLSRRRPR